MKTIGMILGLLVTIALVASSTSAFPVGIYTGSSTFAPRGNETFVTSIFLQVTATRVFVSGQIGQPERNGTYVEHDNPQSITVTFPDLVVAVLWEFNDNVLQLLSRGNTTLPSEFNFTECLECNLLTLQKMDDTNDPNLIGGWVGIDAQGGSNAFYFMNSTTLFYSQARGGTAYVPYWTSTLFTPNLISVQVPNSENSSLPGYYSLAIYQINGTAITLEGNGPGNGIRPSSFQPDCSECGYFELTKQDAFPSSSLFGTWFGADFRGRADEVTFSSAGVMEFREGHTGTGFYFTRQSENPYWISVAFNDPGTGTDQRTLGTSLAIYKVTNNNTLLAFGNIPGNGTRPTSFDGVTCPTCGGLINYTKQDNSIDPKLLGVWAGVSISFNATTFYVLTAPNQIYTPDLNGSIYSVAASGEMNALFTESIYPDLVGNISMARYALSNNDNHMTLAGGYPGNGTRPSLADCSIQTECNHIELDKQDQPSDPSLLGVWEGMDSLNRSAIFTFYNTDYYRLDQPNDNFTITGRFFTVQNASPKALTAVQFTEDRITVSFAIYQISGSSLTIKGNNPNYAVRPSTFGGCSSNDSPCREFYLTQTTGATTTGNTTNSSDAGLLIPGFGFVAAVLAFLF